MLFSTFSLLMIAEVTVVTVVLPALLSTVCCLSPKIIRIKKSDT